MFLIGMFTQKRNKKAIPHDIALTGSSMARTKPCQVTQVKFL